jgi:hypothetical protein
MDGNVPVDYNNLFISKLEQLMLKRGYSIYYVADFAGESYFTIKAVFCREEPITAKVAKKLCALFVDEKAGLFYCVSAIEEEEAHKKDAISNIIEQLEVQDSYRGISKGRLPYVCAEAGYHACNHFSCHFAEAGPRPEPDLKWKYSYWCYSECEFELAERAKKILEGKHDPETACERVFSAVVKAVAAEFQEYIK